MEEIIIREASVKDIDWVQRLGQQTYLETFGAYNTKQNSQAYLAKAFSTDKLMKELTEPNSQWFIVLAENETAGYLKINFANAQTELQDDKAMEIERIYVLQKFQGNSIGKLLMEKAVAIANEHGVDYIWLGVWQQNTKALEFYKKKGFIIFSQHSFFIGDDEQTDWMMKLVLKDSSTGIINE